MSKQHPPHESVAHALASSIDAPITQGVHGPEGERIPVAATVVIARDAAEGVEVLLIQRPEHGSFAGAWVFPGGKFEVTDRRSDEEEEVEVARRAGVRETLEETGLVLDPPAIVPLSCWDPPPGLALRIRTWFFAAAAPHGTLALAADEAVDAQWSRPGEVLTRHSRGELTLYPPTWVTLHALSVHADVDSVLGGARMRGVEHFETVARRGSEGPLLLWRDDAAYGRDASVDSPDGRRHRLEIGSLPWRYTRSG